ncbi:choline transport protein [Ceratobasidium sp. AG-Ba]|nr:choline transport protein [Ceratobasidium sp. AG-Ba]
MTTSATPDSNSTSKLEAQPSSSTPGSPQRTPRGVPAVLTDVNTISEPPIFHNHAHPPGHYPTSLDSFPKSEDSMDDVGGVGGITSSNLSNSRASTIPKVDDSPTNTMYDASHSYGMDSFVSTDSAPPRLRRQSEILASRQMTAPKALEHGSQHRHGRTPKRIIVCCDGTWQDGIIRSQTWMYSNVLKLARCLNHDDERYDPPIPQIVFYQAGIGSEQNIYSRYVDGATGASLAEKVQEAYAFIAHNYAPGDEVYLFGFSRGAYTARMVAGFIGYIGILDRTAMDSFADIFIAMQKKNKAKSEAENKRYEDALAPFKDICDDGRRRADLNHDRFTIKCIGVWDTVGSMGLPTVITRNSTKMHQLFDFPDNVLGPHIERAMHAMSLNEDREDFQVTKFYQTKLGKERGQQLRQVWFAGQHTDVGGGWHDHDLSDVALMWMLANVEDILSIDFKYAKSLPRPIAPWGAQPPHTSQMGIYKLAGQAPRRPSTDPATHETMHVSVKEQALLTPQATEWIEKHPDRFTPLLPLEEEIRQTWGYKPGSEPKRDDSLVAKQEKKNEQAAAKGLLAMAQKVLRSATQTEVIRDEGGRSIYEDSTSCFEDLPEELKIHILQFLQYDDIVRFSATARRYHLLVLRSTSLQLKIELEANRQCISDNHLHKDQQELLESIKRYSESWLNVSLDGREETIPRAPNGEMHTLWELRDGLFASAYSMSEYHALEADTVQVIPLDEPSSRWELIIGTTFHELTTLDPSQDLLLLAIVDPSRLAHAIAKIPMITLRLPFSVAPFPAYSTIGLLVADELLVLNLISNISNEPDIKMLCDVLVIDWHDGALLSHIGCSRGFCSATCLDKDRLLVAINQGLNLSNDLDPPPVQLMLYENIRSLPVKDTGQSLGTYNIDACPILAPIIGFEFPAFDGSNPIVPDFLIRSGPVPSEVAVSSSNFHPDFACRTLSLSMRVQIGMSDPISYMIFIDIPRLLSHIPEMPFQSLLYIPWGEWGEFSTRWIKYFDPPSHWISWMHGTRFVRMTDHPIHGPQLMVADFNPMAAKRFKARCLATHPIFDIPSVREMLGEGLWPDNLGTRMRAQDVTALRVDENLPTSIKDLSTAPIVSRLPYVLLPIAGTYIDYVGCMIDGNRLIGIKDTSDEEVGNQFVIHYIRD